MAVPQILPEILSTYLGNPVKLPVPAAAASSGNSPSAIDVNILYAADS